MAALADSKNSNINSNLEELLTFNKDAIALLGHSYRSLSQHCHDLISALCSPQIPITRKIFGDELQSQLRNIKTLHKISNLAAGASNSRFHDEPGNNKKIKSFFRSEGKEIPLQPEKNGGRIRSSDCKLFTD